MKRNYGGLYAAPQALWLSLFFAAPLAIIVAYSFMKKGLYGGVEPEASLDAYRALANPTLLLVAFRTLWVSLAATAATILVALPCGYSIARSRNQSLGLFLVIVPFWTNFLVRIYAWIAILGNEGFLNDFLRLAGLVGEPLQFLYNQGAVILVLVYMYLPYAILPLFSTIDKFDFTLLEAARDLGASRLEAIVKVLLPNIRGGLVTAVLFTFIPIFGAYAVPLLVGGKDSYMLGNVIADQVTKTRNWPLASAISMTVTFLTAVAAMLFALRSRRKAVHVEIDAGVEATAATRAAS
ncbi:MAG TPA: ABC transporter permease [Spirochaetales bacterium]|nr:ABC transporter permease [Spirochaetales bacterium]HRY53630.1 ABC transporter permease [Spirochaetia bacterium]HRZ63739.1 ABC transporter permease [Spirochaetia bacterium]